MDGITETDNILVELALCFPITGEPVSFADLRADVGMTDPAALDAALTGLRGMYGVNIIPAGQGSVGSWRLDTTEPNRNAWIKLVTEYLKGNGRCQTSGSRDR